MTGVGCRKGFQDQWVYLSCDVSLQASRDVLVAQSLLPRAFDVGQRLRVAAHPVDRDDVEGAVGLPVAAAVESVSVGAAGAGGDGGDSAEGGEGPFVPDPFGVVAGGDE